MSVNIPIFMASDNNYAVGVATTLLSILKHTNSFCEFYVLDSGISDENKNKIIKSLDNYKNHTLEFIDVKEIDLSQFPNIAHFSLSCYLRYFIPDLKKDIHRAIYTDVDVIFMEDIQDYYNIDLEGYPLGAVPEEIGREFGGKFNHKKRKKEYGIPFDHIYFQSGNLIIDCDKWRELEITPKLVGKTIELRNQLLCPDLDVMNIVFANNYKKLDFKYCATTCRIKSTDGHQELEEAFNHPFIIHYGDYAKPWKYSGTSWGEEYDKILKETAFDDILESRKYYNNQSRCGEVKMAELQFEKNDRILVLAPHPDDEVIGCGGLIAKYASQIDVIVLTDGRYSNPSWTEKKTIETRKNEFVEAMKMAKVNSYEMLGIEDSKLSENFEKFKQIDFSKYSHIFIPNKNEFHPDHKIVYDFIKRSNIKDMTDIVSYEVWTPLVNPESYININKEYQIKGELISYYKSQLISVDYVSYILGLNHYRGLPLRQEYLESYNVVPFSDIKPKSLMDRFVKVSKNKKGKTVVSILGMKLKI